MERNVAPANWLYHDRGMVKWMGFFLADHTAYNEKQGVAEQPVEGEDEQSLEETGALLLNAWQAQSSVSLQLKVH
ncbi:DNA-directed RNA polymerase subunit beta [Schleiferilactobacillus harbinensis]|uniref:DNA-directed RNA polymerase subunit beta n=1 Tax=Schleiferilactobacillus harbinensis TaxID=304207 RepID=UPI00345F06B1